MGHTEFNTYRQFKKIRINLIYKYMLFMPYKWLMPLASQYLLLVLYNVQA